MAPVVHGLENKYGAQINFVFLDIDDPATQSIQDAFGYARAWRPYFMLLGPNGEVLTRPDGTKYIWIGVVPGDEIELAIADVLPRFTTP